MKSYPVIWGDYFINQFHKQLNCIDALFQATRMSWGHENRYRFLTVKRTQAKSALCTKDPLRGENGNWMIAAGQFTTTFPVGWGNPPQMVVSLVRESRIPPQNWKNHPGYGFRINGNWMIVLGEVEIHDVSHEKKTTWPYFPWNPGCLMGILIMVYCNPPHNWTVYSLMYRTLNNYPKQPGLFSMLICWTKSRFVNFGEDRKYQYILKKVWVLKGVSTIDKEGTPLKPNIDTPK